MICHLTDSALYSPDTVSRAQINHVGAMSAVTEALVERNIGFTLLGRDIGSGIATLSYVSTFFFLGTYAPSGRLGAAPLMPLL